MISLLKAILIVIYNKINEAHGSKKVEKYNIEIVHAQRQSKEKSQLSNIKQIEEIVDDCIK
jgi:hypothetical protein